MSNSEFEKQVKQNMEELRLPPPASVWDKVEASLDKKKKRRWLIFLLLFAVISTVGLLLWKNYGNAAGNNTASANPKNDQHIAQQVQDGSNTVKENANKTIVEKARENIINDTISNSNKVISGSLIKDPVQNDQPSLYSSRPLRKATKAQYHVKTTNADTENITKKDKIKKSRPGKTSVEVVAADAEEKTEPLQVDKEEQSAPKHLPVTTSSPDTIKKQPDVAKNIQPEAEKKSDTSKSKPAVAKKKRNAWEYSASAGFGISIMTSASHTKSNSNSYASPVLAGPVTSLGPYLADSFATPYHKIAFHAALHMQKKIAKKWDIKTGIAFARLSNRINARIDSAGLARVGARYGYKQHYNLVSLPLTVQYSFGKKMPLSIETGPALNYLLGSNAVVYRRSTSGYFLDKQLFNRLQFSWQLGAGFQAGKISAHPFNIGFQFSLGLSPAFKNTPGSKSLSSAQFYLRVPFKK